jgi:hypothetical protein
MGGDRGPDCVRSQVLTSAPGEPLRGLRRAPRAIISLGKHVLAATRWIQRVTRRRVETTRARRGRRSWAHDLSEYGFLDRVLTVVNVCNCVGRGQSSGTWPHRSSAAAARQCHRAGCSPHFLNTGARGSCQRARGSAQICLGAPPGGCASPAL